MCEDESSVRVAVRVRPQIAREVIDMCRVCTTVTPGEPQVWLGSDKAFTYDHVFDMATAQEEVYNTCVHNLIEGCFDGYNATVLAYGQTGSGKTYTMGTGLEVDSVSADLQGIVPRAMQHLFTGMTERRKAALEKEKTPPEFKITAHFMELYNEDIIDLFDPNFKGVGKSGVKIHEDAAGGIYVSGITTRTVTSVEDAMACLRTGALSRTTASTNMNAQSSRSHAVFTINVSQQRMAEAETTLTQGEDGEMVPEGPSDGALPEFETLTAKFHFVDLAGSERLKRTGATGDRVRESISINCGLLALGNVISALGDVTKKATHVPYRDSKLTRLLQDSLGGNSQTVMIACISPSDTDFMETLNTLKYANRARNIKNRVTVNQDKTSKTIALLRLEIQQLQVELMEYRQGKRIVSQDGSEAVNDMFHENQMLSVECNNLRTRIKALQETVDVLTAKNTALLAEKATGLWVNSSAGEEGNEGGDTGGGTSDITTLIQGYLQEIEELRAKLCESEQVCQQLRKQVHNRANARYSVSPMAHIPITGSMVESVVEESGPNTIAELIEEAKHDLQKDMREISAPKKRKKKISRTLFNTDIPNNDDEENNKENERENGVDNMDDEEMEEEDDNNNDEEEEEDSSDESSEDKAENYNEELADLTSEISIKQKLIEGLEQSQRRLETMKLQYEEKLTMLMNRIRATQDERDKVLANLKPSAGGDDKVKQVKQDYERKINLLQKDLKKMQSAQKEHAKLMREKTQHERQLRTLKADLADMKRAKVRLMNKMKEDSNRAKKEDVKKNREIAQLRKETLKKESLIKNLEAENRLKNIVLKRKTQEIAVLKKAPKPGLSEKASGKVRKKIGPAGNLGYSPKVAKSKWHNLEQNINKVAYNKQTISSLERDMDRWLKERESLSRQLEKVCRRRERLDPSSTDQFNDLNEQVDGLRANINYIHENIAECQENIMAMEENRDGDPETLVSTVATTVLSMEESQYIINKLINMTVNQATLAAQKQATISELEHRMKQMEQNTTVQEQLLCHVLGGTNHEVFSLMSSLLAGDESQNSTDSSRSPSPSDEQRPLDGLLVDSSSPCSTVSHRGGVGAGVGAGGELLLKARSRTTTPQDMLFTNGSDRSSAGLPSDDSHPNSASNTINSNLAPGGTTTGLLHHQLHTSTNAPPPTLPHPSTFHMYSSTSNLSGAPVHGGGHAGMMSVNSNSSAASTMDPRMTTSLEGALGRGPEETQYLSSLKSMHRVVAAPGKDSTAPEVTPPSSPSTYRRTMSREDNVFNRLTSSTAAASGRHNRHHTGVINPYTGRVSQRSVLACTHVAEGHTKAVLSVYATEDKLFSASKDRTVKVWDLVRGQEIETLTGHPNNVNCVKYCESTNTCYTVSSSYIKVWDLREDPSKCTRTLSSSGLTTNGPVAVSAHSRSLMPPGETQINDIALSPSSNILYSGASNIVRVWDLRMHMSVGKLSGGHQAPVMCLAVDSTQSGVDVVATGSKDHCIKVFDVADSSKTGLISSRLNLDPPHYDGIQSLAMYGDTLFSGSRDMCIKKWNIRRGELVMNLNAAHRDWVCALCFNPGGQILLSGCRGGVVKMWSTESCQVVGELRAHASTINAITTNSTCIFTASNDCSIGMWRVRTSYDVSPELSDAS